MENMNVFSVNYEFVVKKKDQWNSKNKGKVKPLPSLPSLPASVNRPIFFTWEQKAISFMTLVIKTEWILVNLKGCSSGELEVSIYDVRWGKTDRWRSNSLKRRHHGSTCWCINQTLSSLDILQWCEPEQLKVTRTCCISVLQKTGIKIPSSKIRTLCNERTFKRKWHDREANVVCYTCVPLAGKGQLSPQR